MFIYVSMCLYIIISLMIVVLKVRFVFFRGIPCLITGDADFCRFSEVFLVKVASSPGDILVASGLMVINDINGHGDEW